MLVVVTTSTVLLHRVACCYKYVGVQRCSDSVEGTSCGYDLVDGVVTSSLLVVTS